MDNNKENGASRYKTMTKWVYIIVPSFFVLIISVFFTVSLKNSITNVQNKLVTINTTLQKLDDRLQKLDNRLEGQEILVASLQKEGYVEKPGLSSISKDIFPSVVFVLSADDNKASLEYNSDNKVLTQVGHADIKGTGFFISNDGFIATAKHVVSGIDPNGVIIKDYNGKIHKAKVVRFSEISDIAILFKF